MNKTVIIAAVVLIVLLGGGALVLSNRSNQPTPSTSATAESSAAVATETQSTGTLGSLLNAGTNQMCTFSSDTVTSGTVYVSTDKIRGSFTTEAGETADMIKDGEWFYIWSSSLPQGIKTKLDLTASAETETDADSYVDTKQQVNYECKPWSVDASQFILPENVTFTDISASVNQQMNIEDSSGMRAEQCAACNNLSGEAKAYCEKTFCN